MICIKCNKDLDISNFSLRDGKNPRKDCKKCSAVRASNWYLKNKKRAKETRKKYYKENLEIFKLQAKKWYTANKDRLKIHKKLYFEQYRLNNLEKRAACEASRRFRKYKATPTWLSNEDKVYIKVLYRIAKRIELRTGIKMHVDHIIPLKGKNITGLHVPWNLQILAQSENCAKGNRI